MRLKQRTNQEWLRQYNKFHTQALDSLNNWAFEDINRAIRGGAKRGAFILASCFVDYLTCFYNCQPSTGRLYAGFVNRYMPLYDGGQLYKSLRCRLAHNYSIDKYALTHHHHRLHLKFDKGSGLQIINLRSFINDIKKAEAAYISDLENDDRLKINFIRWYRSSGVLMPTDIGLVE